jgi:hypothetical protein
MMLTHKQKVVPIKIKSVESKLKISVKRFEIFQDGEWQEIDLRDIKKDQIFRINIDGNIVLRKAYKDASLDPILGWGITSMMVV